MSLDHDNRFVKSQAITKDAFLDGRLVLKQPKTGFRAGVDSVLLGASVAANSRTLLDLGAGVGTASLCALALDNAQSATLVESNDLACQLCAENITANDMASRAKAVDLDVKSSGQTREAAGLKPDHFTSVIANPPYFDRHAGTNALETGRADARHMPDDELDHWARAAAASAAPKGEVIFIYRADGLPQLLAAFTHRFGSIAILPIVSRPGGDASRILMRGIKGSRGPLKLMMPLVLHNETGNAYRADVEAIFRGEQVLHW